jgi:hypothetical protein
MATADGRRDESNIGKPVEPWRGPRHDDAGRLDVRS